MSNQATESAELARRETFSADQLRSVSSFAELSQLINETGIVVTDVSSVLGDGFSVLPTDEKNTLIGVPFVILSWTFSEGDNGEFVSLRIVTRTDRKLIINDGSTGIHDQVRKMHADGVLPVVFVPRGLRVSEYDYEDDHGKKKRASTFYLNTSAE